MKAKILLLSILAAGLSSCNSYFSDMDIRNEYDPDIDAVMGDVNQYPSLIGGGYSNWWDEMLNCDGNTWCLAMNADAYSPGAGNWDMKVYAYYKNYEKPEIGNTDQNNAIPKNMWYNNYSRINTVKNMLSVMKEKNLVYKESGEDVTYKILANCYFLMGAYYTEMALMFDKCFIITEDTDINAVTGNDLQPASAVQATALSYLDKCIAICNEHNFDNFDGLLPSNVISTSEKLKQMANFMAARAIAYFPRNNTETVDWSKVLKYIDNGLTEDIKATLPLQNFDTWSLAVACWPDGMQWARVNMRVVHMMAPDDPNAPWPLPTDFTNDKTLPEAQSPDYRLGTDFIYFPEPQSPSGGISYAGYQYYSCYALKRFTESGQPSGVGDLYLFMKAESDLLKAEALLNSGRKADAVPLINNTRVERGHLNDITSASSDDEVLEAIYYERFVECGYAYAATPFYDRRRTPIDKFQLATRSFREYPVPMMELTFWNIDSYTFGGEPDKNDKYKF